MNHLFGLESTDARIVDLILICIMLYQGAVVVVARCSPRGRTACAWLGPIIAVVALSTGLNGPDVMAGATVLSLLTAVPWTIILALEAVERSTRERRRRMIAAFLMGTLAFGLYMAPQMISSYREHERYIEGCEKGPFACPEAKSMSILQEGMIQRRSASLSRSV